MRDSAFEFGGERITSEYKFEFVEKEEDKTEYQSNQHLLNKHQIDKIKRDRIKHQNTKRIETMGDYYEWKYDFHGDHDDLVSPVQTTHIGNHMIHHWDTLEEFGQLKYSKETRRYKTKKRKMKEYVIGELRRTREDGINLKRRYSR